MRNKNVNVYDLMSVKKRSDRLKRVNFFEQYTKVDFKAPDILFELNAVIKEINQIDLGAKIDPEKMRIILSIREIADGWVKECTPVGFDRYKDFWVAGFIAGILAQTR